MEPDSTTEGDPTVLIKIRVLGRIIIVPVKPRDLSREKMSWLAKEAAFNHQM
jgi:hypothetical protein